MKKLFSVVLLISIMMLSVYVKVSSAADTLYQNDANTVLLLHFNEAEGDTVADASSNANTGTISGGAGRGAGVFGSALNFDGVDDYVTIPNHTSLNVADNFTIEFWFKPTTIALNKDILFRNWNWRLAGRSGNILRMIFYDSAGGLFDIFTPALTLGVWHHIAATYGSGHMGLYVDGTRIGYIPTNKNPLRSENGNPLYIGRGYPSGEKWSYFTGSIDELRISKCIRYTDSFDPYNPPLPCFLYGVYFHPIISSHMAGIFNESIETMRAKQFKDIKKHYINTAYSPNYFPDPTIGTTDSLCADIKKYGLYLVPGLHPAAAQADVPQDVIDACSARLEKYKDESNILYWALADEAKPQHILSFIKLKKLIEGISQKHWGETGFGFDFELQSSMRYYAPYLNVYYSTNYPIRSSYATNYPIRSSPGVRDPWIMGERVRNIREFAGNKPAWTWIQGYQDKRIAMFPSVPEFRVMCYQALANGAKGLYFFIYNHETRWRIVPWGGEKFDFTLTTPWIGATNLWEEVGNMGKYFTSIGPLLAKTQVVNSPEITVDTVNIDCGGVQRPAIATGVLRDSGWDVDYYVVFNNDVNNSRQTGPGGISIPKQGDKNVFDLYNLSDQSIGTVGETTVSFSVSSLLPGEGRIFLFATQQEFADIKNQILRKRINAERDIIKIDLEQVQAYNPESYNITFQGYLQDIQTAWNAGNYVLAMQKVDECKSQITTVLGAAPSFNTVSGRLENIRDVFTNINNNMNILCLTHGEDVIGPCRNQIITLSQSFFDYENEFLAGNAVTIASQVETLYIDVSNLDNEIAALL